MSKQVNVAVLGAGKAGLLFGKAVNASANGRLAMLVAATADEAATVGASLPQVDHTSGNWRDAIESDEVQAVFIATPTYLHAEMTIAAAKAGKHVLCDKPLCLSVSDADAMLEACKDAGVLLMVGFLERFNPAFRVAKERIRTGRIGRPVMVIPVGTDRVC